MHGGVRLDVGNRRRAGHHAQDGAHPGPLRPGDIGSRVIAHEDRLIGGHAQHAQSVLEDGRVGLEDADIGGGRAQREQIGRQAQRHQLAVAHPHRLVGIGHDAQLQVVPAQRLQHGGHFREHAHAGDDRRAIGAQPGREVAPGGRDAIAPEDVGQHTAQVRRL